MPFQPFSQISIISTFLCSFCFLSFFVVFESFDTPRSESIVLSKIEIWNRLKQFLPEWTSPLCSSQHPKNSVKRPFCTSKRIEQTMGKHFCFLLTDSGLSSQIVIFERKCKYFSIKMTNRQLKPNFEWKKCSFDWKWSSFSLKNGKLKAGCWELSQSKQAEVSAFSLKRVTTVLNVLASF